jgi:hypothetical protein
MKKIYKILFQILLLKIKNILIYFQIKKTLKTSKS